MKSIWLRPGLLGASLVGLVACSSSSIHPGDGAAGSGGAGGVGGNAQAGAGGADAGAGGAGGSLLVDGGACDNDVQLPATFVTAACSIGYNDKGGGPIPDGVYELVDRTISGVRCPHPLPQPASRAFRVSGATIVGVDALVPSYGAQPVVSRWSAELRYFGSVINFKFSCGDSTFGTAFTVDGNRVWFNVDTRDNLTETWHFQKR
jgi:hypothetical protein